MSLGLNNSRCDVQIGLGLEGGVSFDPPAITELDVTEGSIAGGTAVVVTGSGFRDGCTVTLGGTAVDNLSVDSATQISFDTPAQTAVALADLVITNDDEQSATETDAFSYFNTENGGDWELSALGPPDSEVVNETCDTLDDWTDVLSDGVSVVDDTADQGIFDECFDFPAISTNEIRNDTLNDDDVTVSFSLFLKEAVASVNKQIYWGLRVDPSTGNGLYCSLRYLSSAIAILFYTRTGGTFSFIGFGTGLGTWTPVANTRYDLRLTYGVDDIMEIQVRNTSGVLLTEVHISNALYTSAGTFAVRVVNENGSSDSIRMDNFVMSTAPAQVPADWDRSDAPHASGYDDTSGENILQECINVESIGAGTQFNVAHQVSSVVNLVDAKVSFEFYTGTVAAVSHLIGACLRVNTGDANSDGYYAYMNYNSGFILAKRSGGTFTTFSTTATSLSADTKYRLEFEVQGTVLTARIVLVSTEAVVKEVTYDDTADTFPGAGSSGFVTRNRSADTMRLRNIKTEEPAAA